MLGLQQELSLYSVDVKDALLQVPQRTPCACHFPKEYLDLFGDQDPSCRNEGLLLLRVLPGQRDAALLWSSLVKVQSSREREREREVERERQTLPFLFSAEDAGRSAM